MVSTPVVKEESLGFFRSMSDITQTREANNLYYDLEHNLYDPSNQPYIDKLDRTAGIFARTNDPRLPSLLNLCRDNYKGQIKISDQVGLAMHICLTNEIKTKLKSLKPTLESNDRKFLEEQNKEIAALKEFVAQQITALKTNLDNHITTRNNLLQQNGDIIREYKKAALISHKLSRFKIPKDGYCSDNNEQNPDEVNKFYTDTNLLVKINMYESTYLTVEKTNKTLSTLNQLNRVLLELQPLRYQ